MDYAKQMVGSMEGSCEGGLSAGTSMLTNRQTTVAQNIDNRIAGLREQIARLEQVKQKLSRGTILDVSLEDLQMALGRY
jgi:hypothetical protein